MTVEGETLLELKGWESELEGWGYRDDLQRVKCRDL